MKNRNKYTLLLIGMIYLLMVLWMNAKALGGQEPITVDRIENAIKEWGEDRMFSLFFPYLSLRKEVVTERMKQKGNHMEIQKEEEGREESKGESNLIENREERENIGIQKLDQRQDTITLEEVLQRARNMEKQETEAEESFKVSAGLNETTLGKTTLVKQQEIREEDYSDYQKLIHAFFTIDASTSIGAEELNFHQMMQKDMRIDDGIPGPQILIYHTHSQEAFLDSVPGDEESSIMAVADYLAEILQEQYGYRVYRLRGKYDTETRTGAYTRALEDLEKVLEENPGIQVLLDIHRDDMKPETHLLTSVDGKPTARFMFFNGLSRTTKNGKIDYLENANLSDNLAFSFQAKVKAEEYFPGLTRSNYLHAYRYNLHLRQRSMLIEIGAQNNTLEEELNACEPLARILHMVLSGE